MHGCVVILQLVDAHGRRQARHEASGSDKHFRQEVHPQLTALRHRQHVLVRRDRDGMRQLRRRRIRTSEHTSSRSSCPAVRAGLHVDGGLGCRRRCSVGHDFDAPRTRHEERRVRIAPRQEQRASRATALQRLRFTGAEFGFRCSGGAPQVAGVQEPHAIRLRGRRIRG